MNPGTMHPGRQQPWHGLQDIDPRRLQPAPTPEYVHALATAGATVCRTTEAIPRKTDDKTSVTCPGCLAGGPDDGGPAGITTAELVAGSYAYEGCQVTAHPLVGDDEITGTLQYARQTDGGGYVLAVAGRSEALIAPELLVWVWLHDLGRLLNLYSAAAQELAVHEDRSHLPTPTRLGERCDVLRQHILDRFGSQR